MTTSAKEKPVTHVAALILMAASTLGSAWAGFQTGLWNSMQTFRLADAAKQSRLSSQNALLASQERNLDAALFEEYARAFSEHNASLAAFLHDRMRPELRPALDAWLATKPLHNRNAPPSPFEMPEYQLKAQKDAGDEDLQANALRDQAEQASHTVDNYTLTILLFTSALFLAGLVTGFEDERIRWTMIGHSLVPAGFATFILTTLPIARR